MLPFTHDQFIEVFARYNTAVWPAQIAAYLVAAAMLYPLLKPMHRTGRWVTLGLAAMWAWTGIAYHWVFFSEINAAAWLFGSLFVAQAVLLVLFGTLRGHLVFSAPLTPSRALGWLYVGYALVVYPLLGMLAGQEYPGLPTFGITPCPLTLFTFGILLLAGSKVPRSLLAIPLAWSLVGGSAAFLLRVPQDWALLFGGVIAVAVILWRDGHRRGGAHPGLKASH